MRYHAAIAATLVAVCAIALTGCRQKEPTTATVVRRDVIGHETLRGELVTPPAAHADVMPPYRAPVERVLTSVGARVDRGDVLVQLAFPTVEAALERARTQVQAEEASLERARAAFDADVRAAREEVQAAREAERVAQAMRAEGAEADVEGARARRIAAESALRAAEADLQLRMLPYNRRVEAARQHLRDAQEGARHASIRAPISGTVLVLNAQPGQEIGADAEVPVAVIVNLAELQVHAALNREQSEIVEEGAEAELLFRDLPNERFDGRVASIVTRPHPRQSDRVDYVAIVEFDNTQGHIKPEAELQSVAIRTGEAKNVLAVPTEAVERDDTGRPVVHVLIQGEWQPRVVEPGLSGGGYTEIRTGLEEGETVRVPA